MDIKKLKYMMKMARKYAKYNSKAEEFFNDSYEASEKNQDKKSAKLSRKAYRYRTKAYYIKQVYDLEVKIQGAINNIDTEWDEL